MRRGGDIFVRMGGRGVEKHPFILHMCTEHLL